MHSQITTNAVVVVVIFSELQYHRGRRGDARTWFLDEKKERIFSKVFKFARSRRGQRDIFEGKIPLKMQRSSFELVLFLSLSFSLKRARASSREEQTTLFRFFVSRALRVRSSLAVIDRSRSEETERKRKKSVSLLCGVLSSRKRKKKILAHHAKGLVRSE